MKNKKGAVNIEEEISLNLLENGLDFIDNSLDSILSSNDKHALKYSVLHISAGIELVLKEILMQEHWSLVFEKVDLASDSKLKSGDFISVTFDTTIKRLENIVGVKIDKAAKDKFDEIRKIRNKIEHFSFSENDKALKSIVSDVLYHILDITSNNVDVELYSDYTQTLFNSIMKKASNFERCVNLIYESIKDRLRELSEEGVDIVKCPTCFKNTFPLSENNTCLFCGYTDTPENVARAYIENVLGISEFLEVKDGGEFPLTDCSECDKHSLVMTDDSCICFSCSTKRPRSDYDYCNYCNAPFIEYPGDQGRCSGCNSNVNN